jgi:hypothetical protein
MATVPEYDCSFAGVPFRMPTKAVIDMVERHSLLDDHIETMAPTGRALQALARRKWPTRRPRLGEFFMPIGMARCATFYGLMTGVDLEKVAKLIFLPNSVSYPPIGTVVSPYFSTLRIKCDGLEGTQYITHPMAMLPPRRIADTSDLDGGLYLVTLVDDRWWLRSNDTGSLVPSIGGSTTWPLLFSYIEFYLGTTLAGYPDPAASAYGQPEPDSAMYMTGEPAHIALDAVAANVGGFMYANPNSPHGYKFRSWNDALTSTQLARVAHEDRIAGGAVLSPDTTKSDKFRALSIPYGVVVRFPLWETDVGYYEPENYRYHYRTNGVYGVTIEKTVYPTDLGSPYSSILPHNYGQRVLRTTAKATMARGTNYTTVTAASATNASALTALAQQLAKDYYDCALASLDEVYQGIQNWPRDTGHDIIWAWTEAGTCTHVRRLPFDSATDEFQHGFTALEAKRYVKNADMVDSSACSVLGRSANSAGVRADITASTNNRFLARRSNALSFDSLALTDLPALSGLSAGTPATSDFAAGTIGGANSKFTIANILALQTLPPLFSAVPSSSGASGSTGQMAFDNDYLYICIITDQWKRIALSSF